jgi:hypothetical protein
LTLIKVKRVIIIIYLIFCINCPYLRSTQRLFKHLLFEESFTRYKTYVIIACAQSIDSEVRREIDKENLEFSEDESSLSESVSFSGYVNI